MNTFRKFSYYALLAVVAMFAAVNTTHAQVPTKATLQCPGGPPTWDAATFTVTCPPPSGGGGGVPPVDPPPGTVPGACPAGTLWIKGQWGNSAIDTGQFTPDFGGYDSTKGAVVMVVEVKPPTTGFTGTKTSSWSEFGSGPTARYAALSLTPCDFTKDVLKNGYGQKAISIGNGVSFVYKQGATQGFTLGLQPGTTYYWNVKNTLSDGVTNTCTIANCRMRGGLPQ